MVHENNYFVYAFVHQDIQNYKYCVMGKNWMPKNGIIYLCYLFVFILVSFQKYHIILNNEFIGLVAIPILTPELNIAVLYDI